MATLPEYAVLDPKLERLPRPLMRELQSERLRAMVRYVYEETPFWRRKLDSTGLKPDEIRGLEDLPRIPFCTKEELQEDQAQHPPFGLISRMSFFLAWGGVHIEFGALFP